MLDLYLDPQACPSPMKSCFINKKLSKTQAMMKLNASSFSELYFRYPFLLSNNNSETTEQPTRNQKLCPDWISRDHHSPDWEKSDLNCMSLLCLNYQGKWTKLGFTSTGPRKVAWQNCFHLVLEAYKQTENDLSSLAQASLCSWFLGTRKQGYLPGSDSDPQLCAIQFTSTGKHLLWYPRTIPRQPSNGEMVMQRPWIIFAASHCRQPLS